MINRRTFIKSSLPILGTLSITGCLGNDVTINADPPDNPVTNAPIPSNPERFNYPILGKPNKAKVGVTAFFNYKCPICAQYSKQKFPRFVQGYIETEKVALVSRTLSYTSNGQPFLGPDAPRISRAGLAIWHNEPTKFWDFSELIFHNQPSESVQWGTKERILAFAEAAGVNDLEAVRKGMESQRNQQLITRSSQQAANLGIPGTPIFVVDGQLFNPISEEQQLFDAIDSKLN